MSNTPVTVIVYKNNSITIEHNYQKFKNIQKYQRTTKHCE